MGLEAVKTQEGTHQPKVLRLGIQATPVGYFCYLYYRVRIQSHQCLYMPERVFPPRWVSYVNVWDFSNATPSSEIMTWRPGIFNISLLHYSLAEFSSILTRPRWPGLLPSSFPAMGVTCHLRLALAAPAPPVLSTG